MTTPVPTRHSFRLPVPFLFWVAPLSLLLALLLALSAPARAWAPMLLESTLDAEVLAFTTALAESIDARLAVPGVRILEADGPAVRISIGSRHGIRSWSRVVLLRDGAGPWSGEVRDVDETSTWLTPVPGRANRESALPPSAVGTQVRARVNAYRIGLAFPPDVPAERGLLVHASLLHLEQALQERHGWDAVPVAAFGDQRLQREVAARAGVDYVVIPTLRVEGLDVRLGAEFLEARRDHARPAIALPPSRSAVLIQAMNDTMESHLMPLPGTHHAARIDRVPGALLDLFVRRWNWSDVRAVFDDRIETWTLSPTGIRTIDRLDLSSLWPPTVPSRWPVGAVVPVNTWYDKEGEEAKVNYSLCSNRRPRYLTLNIDRADPESLWVAVGDGPLDSLNTATDGCFPRLDRVARPAGFVLPEGMPETARARLTLEEALIGPAGVPMRTESGRLRLQKAAVVYYDEASGSLWVSTPTGGSRVPGPFGADMDGYREGPTGAPGVLLTDGVAPGEPDRLSFWVLEKGTLVRQWIGPTFPGSITALDAADRDGDGLEDVVFGVVRAYHSGYVTDVHYLSSASTLAEEQP